MPELTITARESRLSEDLEGRGMVATDLSFVERRNGRTSVKEWCDYIRPKMRLFACMHAQRVGIFRVAKKAIQMQ